MKQNGEASDIIDVYSFSRNGAAHVASGRLNTPAVILMMLYTPRAWWGYFTIGDEYWDLDFLTLEETVFHRLNA